MKPKLIDAAITALAILVAVAPQAKAGAGDGQPEDMVLIPGGSFFQGSADDDPGYRDVEGPRREVHLAPFLLSRHEVTVGQIKTFVERSGYVTDAERNTPVGGRAAEGCWSHQRPGEFSPAWVAGRDWRDPGFAQDESHPVVCVSWNDAQAYVAWLSETSGLRYRLPSESEFEYAAQWMLESDADRTPFDGRPCESANHADRSLREAMAQWPAPASACDDGHAFTAPVGSYAVNGIGLHDMKGNASEWVADCWHAGYSGAPIDGSARETDAGAQCRARVLRGGDFAGSEASLRDTQRSYIPPAFRTYHAGFRLARGSQD